MASEKPEARETERVQPATAEAGNSKVTRRTFLKVSAGAAGALALSGVPRIAFAQRRAAGRIIAFAQGFAWPELFGSKGTEKTDVLRGLEKEVGADIAIEWGDESAVRQKVLADLISRTGRYDVVLLGSDGAGQAYGFGGPLQATGCL